MKIRSHTFILALLVLFSTSLLGQDDACPIPPVRKAYFYDCSSKPCRLVINWEAAAKDSHFVIDEKVTAGAGAKRIDAKTPVILEIHQFNFLRYGLDVSVEEQTVESYVYLESLWKNILLVGSGTITKSATSTLTDEFIRSLRNWRAGLETANENIDTILAKYKNPGLTTTQVVEICSEIKNQTESIATLEGLRKANEEALDVSTDIARMPFYEQTLQSHRETLTRSRALIKTAELIRDGFRKTIPKKKAGTIVTATITPKALGGATESQAVVVEYFSHSELPVTYHVGMTYSTLRDVDFKEVRTVSGSDLFAKVRDEDGTADLSAFLSMPISRAKTGRETLFVSLGTGFKKPGDQLFLTLSVPVWKGFLSAGVASGSVSEGENKVVEKVLNEVGSEALRDLYGTVSTRRDFKFVFGITFKPF